MTPEPANAERLVVSAVRRSADARGFTFEAFSHGWILRLTDGERRQHVFGYHFDLNGVAAARIAGDKAATSSLLTDAGVPAVEHRLFLSPAMSGYVGLDGNWEAMLAYAVDNDWDIVAKTNAGTGGAHVHRVGTRAELEATVGTLFTHHYALALSPYVEADSEHRVVVLDGEAQLVYEKVRGEDEWRHNLGLGASAVDIDDGAASEALGALAVRAMDAVSLRFGSVDILTSADGAQVLEINAGVMMEHYGRSSPERKEQVDAIYDSAVGAMFEE